MSASTRPVWIRGRSLFRARLPLALLQLALLLAGCAGGAAEGAIREAVAGFLDAVSSGDMEEAESYMVNVPEGSLALPGPGSPPADLLEDYRIRRVSLEGRERATAEVAIPGSRGTTVLIFSLKRLDDRSWRLEDSIEARMELGEVRPEPRRAAPEPAPSEGSPPEGTNRE